VAEPGARILDRKPYVAFYANRPYTAIPDEPYDRLIDFAVRERFRYLVVDEGVVKVFRPQLLRLLYDPKLREREQRLEMIYFGGRVKGYTIVIYRVLQPGESKTGKPPRANLRWVPHG